MEAHHKLAESNGLQKRRANRESFDGCHSGRLQEEEIAPQVCLLDGEGSNQLLLRYSLGTTICIASDWTLV